MPRRASDASAEPPEEPGSGAGGTAGKRGRRTLADGRQQVLLYLPPDMIKALKLAAVEGDSSVSQIVERLVAGWLAQGNANPERRSG